MSAPKPEFSRPVAADKVGRDGMTLDIAASPAERAALARRFGLLGLAKLEARCRLRPVAGGMIELACRFAAAATQECVVTLAPVEAAIEQSFQLRYALDPKLLAAGPEEEIDLEADDPPEALEHGAIDLGEAVAQHLALALDPYPRAPGAAFASAGADSAANPFAILKRLKGKS
jgi:uncharacterized metal-binding protein YceD (DUF177 family)